MRRLFLLFFLVCFAIFPAIGQDSLAIKYAKMLSKDNLYHHISFLASDSLAGRIIGEIGHQQASEYIRDYYLEVNLLCPGDQVHFQSFQVVRSFWSEMYLGHNGQKYRNLKDGIIYLGEQNIPEELTFNINFIGNAIQKRNDEKLTIAYYNTPHWLSLRRKYASQFERSFSLIIDNTHANAFDSMAILMSKPFKAARYNFPQPKKHVEEATTSAFVVSEQVASQLFNMTVEQIRKVGKFSGSESKKFKKFKPIEVQVKAEKIYDTLSIDNVLGFIEGTDKKHEVLVISAHYDHLGTEDGQIYNGADDNASGVAAMLEISRIFSEAQKSGHGPRRSILFIAFTGEEKGLFGSRYYAQNPVIPLKNTIANLNIDMIGRVDEINEDRPNYIYLIGSDKISMDLHHLSERVNQTYTQLELDYTYNADDDPNRFYYRSDHYNFAKHNIPVIFYFNGAHADYHEPTDTIEKINFEVMKKRAKLIFHTAWELANADKKPEVKGSKMDNP